MKELFFKLTTNQTSDGLIFQNIGDVVDTSDVVLINLKIFGSISGVTNTVTTLSMPLSLVMSELAPVEILFSTIDGFDLDQADFYKVFVEGVGENSEILINSNIECFANYSKLEKDVNRRYLEPRTITERFGNLERLAVAGVILDSLKILCYPNTTIEREIAVVLRIKVLKEKLL